MIRAVAFIPLFPLVGFAILLPFGRRLGNPIAGWVGTTTVFGSFVATIVTFAALFNRAPASRSFTDHLFTWFNVDRLHVGVNVLADPLSLTMAAFVTGVSTLIHLYSIGYMEHDEDYSKFFIYLNLFVFSMLSLVLADNMLVTFFGWEGVGVCSYFLIAFWFGRPAAAAAGKKAMIYNRIGDAGFLVAMFLVFEKTGSLTYVTVFSRLGHLSSATLIAIALLFFLGACGKSAQIPLFPWLLDAMEGPTPVSTLIHAATMVTAGVYLICRLNPLLHLAPDAGDTIAWIGAATAFVAATAACAQTDIKKVLAYSTVSQLGFMFLAAGCGAYVAALFLMLTHAFYKALLFLSAGSVIHAMGDEQDIKKMGALQRFMPITAATFLVGWLSIAGVPPFSGFWSKSAVLESAWGLSPALWVIGALAAVLTAYYMGREYLLVFAGERRWDDHRPVPVATVPGHEALSAADVPSDARPAMTLPLIVLSVLAVFGGLINLPFHPHLVFLERWLEPVVGASLVSHHESLGEVWVFSLLDAAIAVVGVSLAASLWRRAVNRPPLEPRVLFMGWFIDRTYDRVITRAGTWLATFSSTVIETKVIDGAVNGVAFVVQRSGERLRRVQSGYVRTYALGLVGGLIIVVAYLVVRSVG